jgi:hypothetical protein
VAEYLSIELLSSSPINDRTVQRDAFIPRMHARSEFGGCHGRWVRCAMSIT